MFTTFILCLAGFFGASLLFDSSNDEADDESPDASDADQTLNGTDDADILLGGFKSDAIYGGAGDDELRGRTGNDFLFGDAGDDKLVGGFGDDVLYGGDGDDLLRTASWGNYSTEPHLHGDNEAHGGAGDDELVGGAGDDSLYGDEDDDDIRGYGGADLLEGGTGDDYLLGGTEDDVLLGGAGDDYLFGGFGDDADELFGGDGNDILEVGSNDVATGGAGNDIFSIGKLDGLPAGLITDFNIDEDQIVLSIFSQTIDFEFVEWEDGTGSDLLHGGQVIARIAGGQDLNVTDLSYEFLSTGSSDVEIANTVVTTADYDDEIEVGGGDNFVRAGSGNDYVEGRGTLYGEDGDDVLWSGFIGRDAPIDDHLFGGAGDDILFTYRGTAEGGDGNDIVFSGTGYASGGDGDDYVSTYGAVLTGGAGNDTFEVMATKAIGDDPYVEITDFTPSEDVLVINQFGDHYVTKDMLEVVPWPDGLGADINLNGVLHAKVTGGAGLTVDDISIVDREVYNY